MSRLRLFTVFHGNLDFSALPDRALPLVRPGLSLRFAVLPEGED